MMLKDRQALIKNSKPILLVVSGAAIALGVGALFGYWVSGRQQTTSALPVGSEVVPQEVVLSLSLTTDTGRWQRFRTLGTPASRAVLDQTLLDWRDRFLTQNGLDYERDIRPWVGNEVTIALMPTATATGAPSDFLKPSPTNQQKTIAVFPIARPDAAQAVLTQPPTAPGAKVTALTYQGLQIWSVDGEGDRDYAATVLDNRFLVLGTSPKVIEQVIDTYRGKPSLEDDADYRNAFATTAAPNSFLRFYLNAPQFRALVTRDNLQPVPLLGLTPLQNSQGVAGTMTVTSGGIQIQGKTWLPANAQTRNKVENRASKTLALLPANTLMMAAGSNFQDFWQRYSQQATAPPDSPLNPTTFEAGIRSLTGLDPTQDLFAWMTGEFSLALVPLPNPSPSLRTGLLLTVQSGDRAATEKSLQRLDEVLRSRYQFQVASAQVDGQPVVNWISPFGSLSFSHGWLNSETAFLALGPSLPSAILPKPDTALTQVSPFSTGGDTPVKATHSQFFANVEQLMTSNPPIPLPKLPPEADAVVRAIRTLSASLTIESDRTSQFEIGVVIRQEGLP